jgi:hypothetical protein
MVHLEVDGCKIEQSSLGRTRIVTEGLETAVEESEPIAEV